MCLEELVKQRIVVLDGAVGTMIQQYGLSERDFRGERFSDTPFQLKGDNDVLCLTRPDIVEDIHRRYLEAGADMIETNTFNCQRVSQAEYGMAEHVAEMALKGAQIARRVADRFTLQTPDRPRFVAGSVGPTGKTCSMSPDVTDPAAREIDYDSLRSAYIEQMSALADGGVDAFLIETIFDTLNAKAAIDAAQEVECMKGRTIPIMLSVTISDLAGRTLSGQTLDAFLASVSSAPVFSVGLNCSFGPAQMIPFLRHLSSRAPYYISIYPNAGLPNALGKYDETPDTMTAQMELFMQDGMVNIVGGCCGTTDEYIARFASLSRGYKPHKPVAASHGMWLSGLELLEADGTRFVHVGERCNVAGSRKFLRLIKERHYGEALAIARKQVADGAQVIDVNMDDALLDARQEMTHFLRLIAAEPDIASVPVMIDSSDWNVLEAGLKCLQGKSIVNSISLKEGEESFVRHALRLKRLGAAVVVMCFDEQGQATSYERKIAIAERSYRLLTEKAAFNPCDIIFDPNILTVATGMDEHDDYALNFIRATAWIRRHLPGAHVSGGVSNLSFAFRGNNFIREAMHAVFLHHAMGAGMDFAILNPATAVRYADLPEEMRGVIEDVMLRPSHEATKRLIELADQTRERQEQEKAAGLSAQGSEKAADSHLAWRSGTLEQRLRHALVKGVEDYLEEDLTQMLKSHPRAVGIIEGPLMDAMEEVGQLFAAGKMFLPQVVKSARTMKQAVAILMPTIQQELSGTGTNKRKVLLATVKGDVHDIGKNIVAVVMACNNYEVIDLGVMVPADQIVRKAIEEHVDIIGLSGLITPSLQEMENVAREMERAHLRIPLMIGGATTSRLYVALRLAPLYSGPVVWVKDASQNPIVAHHVLDADEQEDYVERLNALYDDLRREHDAITATTTPIDEAREHKLHLF